ncbi:GNAT family N-acetyltransferase, partial [Streptomyces sp. SID685]
DTPFLHTSARNTNAIRLYESLGFRLRRTTSFLAAKAPERLTDGRAAVPVG